MFTQFRSINLQVPLNHAWSLGLNFNYPTTNYKNKKTVKKSECVKIFHIVNAVYILHEYDKIMTFQYEALKKYKTKLIKLLYYTSKANKTEQRKKLLLL